MFLVPPRPKNRPQHDARHVKRKGKNMRETTIERKLRRTTENKGGLAMKMTGEVGVPDRLLLLPGGRVAFAETKTKTGVLSERQKFMIKRLEALGFQVDVIRTDDDIEECLGEALKKGGPDGQQNKERK